ncbi:MAG: hypothetical protein N3D75_02065 [Candidatus Aenigmarchaeota archaeon]|nr:hypothetical protein [Candidatus Aenigmarchaeota archaeon]
MFCLICKKQTEYLLECDFCGSEGCSECVDIETGLCKKCKNKA